MSTTSSMSCVSSGSSAASIRWDETGLETVKELRRKEKETKQQSIEDAEADAKTKKANRESRRSSEGRRRTPIADVFPDIQEDSPKPSPSVQSVPGRAPLLTLEEATCDGHEAVNDKELSTPLKRARPRPLSEQLLGRKRPQEFMTKTAKVYQFLCVCFYKAQYTILGVISILSAATNDLAQLINHLDLEATPGATPRQPFQEDSARDYDIHKLPKTLCSVSRNGYNQSRNVQDLLEQQIAPWPVLNSYFPQTEITSKGSPVLPSKIRGMHKRTMSPSEYLPESSPPPPIQPLRPAKSRNIMPSSNLQLLGPPPKMDLPPLKSLSPDVVRAPSSMTFGSRSSSRGGESSISSLDDIHNPVFKPTHGHARNRSSLLSSQRSRGSQGSIPEDNFTSSRPLSFEARRQLGMKGTMGGSDVSAYAVDDLDASDPDSDIPDELQDVSCSMPESETGFESETTDDRAMVDLPVFHLIDVNDNHAEIDDMMDVDEDDTKKSFDFTGELQKLNESGGSDRASFVEQLEKAFKTPAKIDLRYDFGGQDNLLRVDVPPLPPLPSGSNDSASTEALDSSESSQQALYLSIPTSSSALEDFPISRLLDAKEPTLLPGSDSFSNASSHDDRDDVYLSNVSDSPVTTASRPSDGELNKSFRFGGFSKSPSQELEPEKPISFSDIIPSADQPNASSSVDDSVINSIIAKASEIPARRPSTNSFIGFDSFEEVRRGFEFHDYRPSFYPPPVASSNGSRRVNHSKQESMMSFASISSYGHVVNPGIPDPLDYGLPSLRERPSSEDMTSTSFSMSIDDTFSFLKHAPPRKRVERDASSFYFNTSGSANRGHRRRESNMSVVSQGPPISLYNRSFGHRHNDSNTSVSSMAHSYAIHGASGGRAAWAHHRQNTSIDSVSIVSTSSSKFGGERMIKATRGVLARQSLEESCLIAEGEDLSASYSLPVFTRPSPATRSRSSTCTSSSSGADTPPLSASDGSSTSDGSQSSIDIAQLNRILANATHPISNMARQRDRARARGEGHRRRISQARMSRSSVYETIEEEVSSPADTPLSQSTASKKSSPTAIQPVFIVDPTDNASIHSLESWDEEHGIVAMRRYYELRSEAEYTVSESRRLWVVTPFSIFALQNFDPPCHPSGMKALLASSVENYGPLPSDLRPRRRRTSSRPSPYPQGRTIRVSLSPEYPRPNFVKETSSWTSNATQSPPLREVTALNPNITFDSPAPNPLMNKKVFSHQTNSPEKVMQKRDNVRPRVPSMTRRNALGWTKRSAKASSELKENNSFGQSMGLT
ncbi:hypothetical protein C8R42DRAFT_718664 [Lentinula raphanica]|nr:hypothetical protein C8R42DRAFT_718664 [Lentinula raphanica]